MTTYFSEKINNYQGFENFIKDNDIEISYDCLFSIKDILKNFIFDVKFQINKSNILLDVPYELAYDENDLFNIEYFCDGYLCDIIFNYINNENKYKELFPIIQKHNISNNKENQVISLYNAYALDKEEEFGIKLDSYNEAINK